MTDKSDRQLAVLIREVDSFVRDRVSPRARDIDAKAEFPRELYDEMGDRGFFGVLVPEEYGGLGLGLRAAIVITERIATASGTCALMYGSCGDAVVPILHGGSQELRNKYLPRLAAGEVVPAFALTEPTAGSDAAALKTVAKRTGDSYTISGRKIFCTNGAVADFFIVFARTGPDLGSRGISAFLVPAETEGVTFVRNEDLMGLRGSPTSEIEFNQVQVSVDNMLGGEGEGFKLGMLTLDDDRLFAATLALGVARGALREAISYAKEREQFGKPIIEHQGLAFLLADMTTQLAAGWSMMDQALWLLSNRRDRATSCFAAMTKLFCTDMAMQLTTDAVQVFGGYGLSKDYPVERMMRDAKAFQIFDGTSQIQKWIIGKQLARSEFPIEPMAYMGNLDA